MTPVLGAWSELGLSDGADGLVEGGVSQSGEQLIGVPATCYFSSNHLTTTKTVSLRRSQKFVTTKGGSWVTLLF